MFKDKTSSAIVAVHDLDRAKRFYGETLGIDSAGDMAGVLTFRTGDTRLIVYKSDSAGTNRANAVVWGARADFDSIIAELRGNGIAFEEYPEMGMDIRDGVHVQGDFRAAWFKDPDGNILHINNM